MLFRHFLNVNHQTDNRRNKRQCIRYRHTNPDTFQSPPVAFWLRYVLVPGYSDFEEDIRSMGAQLGKYQSIQRVEILPYHRLGVHKYEAMGWDYQLKEVVENTPEQLQRAERLFKEYFPTVVVN